jgi:hypothetical protein
MKPVRFCGDFLKRLREFPQTARHDAGYQLEKIQLGKQPYDFKPMPDIGRGVEEIRIRDGGRLSGDLHGPASGRSLRPALFREEVVQHDPAGHRSRQTAVPGDQGRL